MDLLAATPVEALLLFLKKGGIFIYPLFICSLAALAAIGFKAMALTRKRVVPDSLVRKMVGVKAANPKAVRNDLEQSPSALGRLGMVAAHHVGQPQEDITRSVQAAAREEIVRLHSGIGLLDVIITVAPLLGLLGTASGLVVIFEGLGETTDHLVIALGIAQALNTTIFGLAIAVPCVIAHSFFTRKIELLTARLEVVLADYVSLCAHSAK